MSERASPAARLVDVYKGYGRQTVLQGLTFDVHEGEVFGLLGPNGAGKTTALRILTGLSRPASGAVSLLGAPVPSGLPGVLRRVGVAFEDQGFYSRLSGSENLELLTRVGHAEVSRARIWETLDRVGLGGESGKPVKQYSSGMRRRLALAGALVHDPDVLILDEPTAALDPVGVHDLRVLLRDATREGKTLIISSHQLQEVELLADRVLLLDRGRRVAYGRLRDLLPDASGVEVEHPEPDRAKRALVGHGLDVDRGANGRLVVRGAESSEVIRLLSRARLRPTSVVPIRMSLEELFVTTVRGPLAVEPEVHRPDD